MCVFPGLGAWKNTCASQRLRPRRYKWSIMLMPSVSLFCDLLPSRVLTFQLVCLHFPLILYSMLWAYATDCPSSWRSLLLPCLCPRVHSPWASPPASLTCPNSFYSVIKSHITHHLAYRELLNYPQPCFAFFAFFSVCFVFVQLFNISINLFTYLFPSLLLKTEGKYHTFSYIYPRYLLTKHCIFIEWMNESLLLILVNQEPPSQSPSEFLLQGPSHTSSTGGAPSSLPLHSATYAKGAFSLPWLKSDLSLACWSSTLLLQKSISDRIIRTTVNSCVTLSVNSFMC